MQRKIWVASADEGVIEVEAWVDDEGWATTQPPLRPGEMDDCTDPARCFDPHEWWPTEATALQACLAWEGQEYARLDAELVAVGRRIDRLRSRLEAVAGG